MLRSAKHVTAWAILAVIALMVGSAAIAGDFCADGGGAGCGQPCHIACPDGCANTTLLAEVALEAPLSVDEVRWCAPMNVVIALPPPDFQPPRISTV